MAKIYTPPQPQKTAAEQWQAILVEMRKKHMPQQAVIEAVKLYPGLYKAFLSESNTSNSMNNYSTTTNATQQWNELVARQARIHGQHAASRKAIIADPQLHGEYLRECAANGTPDKDETFRYSSARQQWDSVVSKNKQTLPAGKAVAKAVRENPDLHRMMLAEVNSR